MLYHEKFYIVWFYAKDVNSIHFGNHFLCYKPIGPYLNNLVWYLILGFVYYIISIYNNNAFSNLISIFPSWFILSFFIIFVVVVVVVVDTVHQSVRFIRIMRCWNSNLGH